MFFFKAGVHQQPDQSNYLAEGQTQTCKLVNLWMLSVWLVFTSNLNSQTTWPKVKPKLVNLFHDLPLAHKITVNQTGACYLSQACSEDVFKFSRDKLMIPIVLSPR